MERGFQGRIGLEHVLGGRVRCGGGDAEIVDIREAPAVPTAEALATSTA
jgi:hypothetical protein